MQVRSVKACCESFLARQKAELGRDEWVFQLVECFYAALLLVHNLSGM